ncbi:MAG TPA: hypothetical protein PKW96_02360 [Candidatus Aminicenantes bacterium]|nr:hypothetical protein [Candidatus Aminicenantes bacterium]HPS99371.1 hypothetical protein [Candidatus Aminicenantes bacterium]
MKGSILLTMLVVLSLVGVFMTAFISTAQLSQRAQRGMVERYYRESLLRGFLSKGIGHELEKVNHKEGMIRSVADAGILEGSYGDSLREEAARLEVKVEEESRLYGEGREIDAHLTMKALLGRGGRMGASVDLEIFSGFPPFLFFPVSPLGGVMGHYFFPYHRSAKEYGAEFLFPRESAMGRLLNPREGESLRAALRRKCGLEPGEMPIVDGIYVGEGDDGLFLYIKGNVERLLLGWDGEKEYIFVEEEEHTLLLSYPPEGGETRYAKDGAGGSYHGLFSGVLLVEGDVKSFGSGEPMGERLVEAPDSPALGEGVELQLYLGGDVAIDLPLRYDGVSIARGSFKREKSRLCLVQSPGLLEEKPSLPVQEVFLRGEPGEFHGNLFTRGILRSEEDVKVFGALRGGEVQGTGLWTVYEDPDNFFRPWKWPLPRGEGEWTLVKRVVLRDVEGP